MNKQTHPRKVPSLVLDAQPLQRQARSWHALAALRSKFRKPSLQLFGGGNVPNVDAPDATHAQVPDHLLAPRRNFMD